MATQSYEESNQWVLNASDETMQEALTVSDENRRTYEFDIDGETYMAQEEKVDGRTILTVLQDGDLMAASTYGVNKSECFGGPFIHDSFEKTLDEEYGLSRQANPANVLDEYTEIDPEMADEEETENIEELLVDGL